MKFNGTLSVSDVEVDNEDVFEATCSLLTDKAGFKDYYELHEGTIGFWNDNSNPGFSVIIQNPTEEQLQYITAITLLRTLFKFR